MEEGAKPDFLDLDGDGDKKESMKKAFKEKNMKHGGKVHYNKGGKVKRMSCPVDGMAKRGKTKARRKGR